MGFLVLFESSFDQGCVTGWQLVASSSVVNNSLSQRAVFLCAWFTLGCIPKPSLMGFIFKAHINISSGMQLVN